MTKDRLDECNQPKRNIHEQAGPNERVVFAVAYRHGVLQNFVQEYELPAHMVMRVTADGEQVVDGFIPGDDGDLSNIDRVTLAQTSKLEPTEGLAKKLAPIVNRHPEV